MQGHTTKKSYLSNTYHAIVTKEKMKKKES